MKNIMFYIQRAFFLKIKVTLLQLEQLSVMLLQSLLSLLQKVTTHILVAENVSVKAIILTIEWFSWMKMLS